MFDKNIEKSKKLIERLSIFLEFQGDNFFKLSKNIGVSNSYFSKMGKNTGNIGTEIAEKILLYYDNLSPEWLILGKGEMLRTKSEHSEPVIQYKTNYCQKCEEKDKLIKSQQQTIDIQTQYIRHLEQSKPCEKKPGSITGPGLHSHT